MTVPVGSELGRGIVEVDEAYSAQKTGPIQFVKQDLQSCLFMDRITGGEEMGGVQTHAEVERPPWREGGGRGWGRSGGSVPTYGPCRGAQSERLQEGSQFAYVSAHDRPGSHGCFKEERGQRRFALSRLLGGQRLSGGGFRRTDGLGYQSDRGFESFASVGADVGDDAGGSGQSSSDQSMRQRCSGPRAEFSIW